MRRLRRRRAAGGAPARAARVRSPRLPRRPPARARAVAHRRRSNAGRGSSRFARSQGTARELAGSRSTPRRLRSPSSAARHSGPEAGRAASSGRATGCARGSTSTCWWHRSPKSRSRRWDDWARITVPTLVVRGDNGVPRDEVLRMVELHPRARLVDIARARHDVHLENPFGWRDAVETFLRRAPDGARPGATHVPPAAAAPSPAEDAKVPRRFLPLTRADARAATIAIRLAAVAGRRRQPEARNVSSRSSAVSRMPRSAA